MRTKNGTRTRKSNPRSNKIKFMLLSEHKTYKTYQIKDSETVTIQKREE